MKKLIVLLMVLVVGVATQAKELKLVDALIQVESNGKTNAIGDNGKAKGCLQIWDCVLVDVNKAYKKKYTKQDCFDKEKSKEICNLYLKLYGRAYEKKTGKKATAEVLARIWNGGPSGYKKQETVKYWNKVSKYI